MGPAAKFPDVQKISNAKRLAFKQALFGVWLSNNPADKDLKRAMLLAKLNGGQTELK